MPKPKYHILVCTTTRPPGNPRGSCGERGSRELLNSFFSEMERLELFGQILVTESSCLGPCPIGPNVVVYPDGTWYKGVKPADVAEIMEQHIVNGRPVTRLAIPEEMWG
ncbi:MAG: (2Fe-2S) ferredoxin domain-containing protein [Nitrospirae bacterium]|nr:(2Fe-2S) ferredoxin domain-containing protein [Candidatus Manganitrophaceae bacterium]